MLNAARTMVRRVWFWALVAVLVMFLIDVHAARPAANGAFDKTHRVVYRLTGDRGAAITYQQARKAYFLTGNAYLPDTHKIANQPLPWSKTVVERGDYSSFQLLAYPTSGLPNATLTCTITVDGKLAWTATSVGRGAEVKCFALGLGGR